MSYRVVVSRPMPKLWIHNLTHNSVSSRLDLRIRLHHWTSTTWL